MLNYYKSQTEMYKMIHNADVLSKVDVSAVVFLRR